MNEGMKNMPASKDNLPSTRENMSDESKRKKNTVPKMRSQKEGLIVKGKTNPTKK